VSSNGLNLRLHSAGAFVDGDAAAGAQPDALPAHAAGDPIAGRKRAIACGQGVASETPNEVNGVMAGGQCRCSRSVTATRRLTRAAALALTIGRDGAGTPVF
jgi:hypothetical protein